MSVARIVDVRDAVVADIAARWSPSGPDGVTAAWVERLSFDASDPDAVLTGRRVYVLAVNPQLAALARGYWRNTYTVAVLVAERYTGTGDPPDSWVNGLVKWWQDKILYPLSSPELVLTGPGGVVTHALPDPEQPPEVTSFIDRDILCECKGAIICANFSYIDAADHGGT